MRLALNIDQISSKENVSSSKCNVIVLNNTNDHLYQIMLSYEIIGRITIFVSVIFFRQSNFRLNRNSTLQICRLQLKLCHVHVHILCIIMLFDFFSNKRGFFRGHGVLYEGPHYFLAFCDKNRTVTFFSHQIVHF